LQGVGVVGAVGKEGRAFAHVLQHRFCHLSWVCCFRSIAGMPGLPARRGP
jgi:hypothetical protein